MLRNTSITIGRHNLKLFKPQLLTPLCLLTYLLISVFKQKSESVDFTLFCASRVQLGLRPVCFIVVLFSFVGHASVSSGPVCPDFCYRLNKWTWTDLDLGVREAVAQFMPILVRHCPSPSECQYDTIGRRNVATVRLEDTTRDVGCLVGGSTALNGRACVCCIHNGICGGRHVSRVLHCSVN